MIKYIEPSQVVEDDNLNANAIGVYVALLHCSSDGIHVNGITKKRLQKLTGLYHTTLNKYLNKLKHLGYITEITNKYNNYIDIVLKDDNGNYQDYTNEYKELMDYFIDGSWKYLNYEQAFKMIYEKSLPKSTKDKIKQASLNPELMKTAFLITSDIKNKFIDYDYLVNYCIKMVRDWQNKDLNDDEITKYLEDNYRHESYYRMLENEDLDS